MSGTDAQIMCRRNRSLGSVERFLDFMPAITEEWAGEPNAKPVLKRKALARMR